MSDFLNISEASRVTGKSVTTIRDYIKKGKLPAERTTLPNGSVIVAIPLEALKKAGLLTEQNTSTTLAPGNAQEIAEKHLETLRELAEKVARLEAETEGQKELVAELRDSLRAEREASQSLRESVQTSLEALNAQAQATTAQAISWTQNQSLETTSSTEASNSKRKLFGRKN